MIPRHLDKARSLTAWASLLLAASCQVTPQSTSGTQSAAISQDSGGNGPGVLPGTSWTDANAARMTTTDASALFLNAYDATAAASQTACASIFGTGGMNVQPWPTDLKNFLASEIRRLPQLAALKAKSLHGLYYVNNFPVSNGAMTCNDPSTGLVYVLFNSKAMQESISDTHADLQRVTTQTIYVDGSGTVIDIEPNYLVQLMFHELFHVIDYTYYLVNAGTTDWQSMTPQRQTIMSLSWNPDGTSKFPVPGIGQNSTATVSAVANSPAGPGVALTSAAPAKAVAPGPVGQAVATGPNTTARTYTCSLPTRPSTLGSAPVSLGFTTAVPQAVAQEIAATNFLDDYSMDNDREDWAESLAIYFMATRYGQYPSYVVYDRPVTGGQTAGANKVFTFDALRLMTSDQRHHVKICQMAATVLNEDCTKTLASLPSEQ